MFSFVSAAIVHTILLKLFCVLWSYMAKKRSFLIFVWVERLEFHTYISCTNQFISVWIDD